MEKQGGFGEVLGGLLVGAGMVMILATGISFFSEDSKRAPQFGVHALAVVHGMLVMGAGCAVGALAAAARSLAVIAAQPARMEKARWERLAAEAEARNEQERREQRERRAVEAALTELPDLPAEAPRLRDPS